MTDAQVASLVKAFLQRGVVPDDAQCMALIKRFKPTLKFNDLASEPRWEAWICINVRGFGEELNRAVVECVTTMQQAKERE